MHQVDEFGRLGLLLGVAVLVVGCNRGAPAASPTALGRPQNTTFLRSSNTSRTRKANMHGLPSMNQATFLPAVIVALMLQGWRGAGTCAMVCVGVRTDGVQVQAVHVVAHEALEEGVAVLGGAEARLDRFACGTRKRSLEHHGCSGDQTSTGQLHLLLPQQLLIGPMLIPHNEPPTIHSQMPRSRCAGALGQGGSAHLPRPRRAPSQCSAVRPEATCT